jgi:hypothetical protein
MDKKKKSLIRAGSVLLVALAAGHLVQTMNADKTATASERPKSIERVSAGPETGSPPIAAEPVMPVTASMTGAGPASATAPVVSEVAPDSPAPEAEPVLVALPEPAPVLPELASPVVPLQDVVLTDPAALPTPETVPALPSPADVADACAPRLDLAAGQMSTISVTINAPCRAGERIVLRHAGLAVAERLSETGTLALDLPALQSSGEVSILFTDAEILTGSLPIPDLSQLRRFGVQWMAADAFQLYAFENGAGYGDAGSVSLANPVSANGGYLIALGDPTLDLPMLAEVYTFPADPMIKADLAIESAVTDQTCDRELLGETLQLRDGVLTVTDLTLAMPDCQAVGDILVLINPDQDVTLAAAD